MKIKAIAIALFLAVIVGIGALVVVEKVPAGYVGVVYSAKGVERETLSQGWHMLSPLKKVKDFPISQQQIVFSNNAADYNDKDHSDWSIDAPANGGIVRINLTVNYNFLDDRVVSLYERFNGMDGEDIVANRVQNSIVAYVKEVTPRFTVMEIYSEKKDEVNRAIAEHLNQKLTEEYGINIVSALITDVQLNETLMEKIQAKEQAKMDAENAELERQTALAQAETEKVKAQAAADVAVIEAQANADVVKIQAEAEAEANKAIAASITQELIAMKEAEAREKHGWVTITGADSVIADTRDLVNTEVTTSENPVQNTTETAEGDESILDKIFE